MIKLTDLTFNQNGVNALALNYYKPYINYNWSTINSNGVQYLKNTGKSVNAEMFTGRALSFDSASSQSINNVNTGNGKCILFRCTINETDVYRPFGNDTYINEIFLGAYNTSIRLNGINVAFATFRAERYVNHSYCFNVLDDRVELYEDGIKVDETLGDFTTKYYSITHINKQFTTTYSGDLSNIILINEALTPQQIADYHTTPHTFLYKDGSSLVSDSGLDTSKVIAWFPMTENDKYVRDVANYSEGSELVTNGTFDTDLNGWDIPNGTPYVSNGEAIISSGCTGIESNIAIVKDNTYVVKAKVLNPLTNSNNIVIKETDGMYIGTYTIAILAPSDTPYEIEVVYTAKVSNGGLYFRKDNALDSVTIDNVSVKQLSSIYPITNYTTDMPLKGLNYGLQTAKLLLDSNGVVVGKSDFAEFYGDGYVDTGHNSSNLFSVEFIAYISDYTTRSTYQSIFGVREATDANEQNTCCTLNYISNSMRVYSGSSWGQFNVTANQYNTYTFTYDGTTALMYENGVIKYTKATNIVANQDPMYIGAERYSTVSRYPFESPIRLFKVHNKVLTQEEVTENYNKAVAQGLLS